VGGRKYHCLLCDLVLEALVTHVWLCSQYLKRLLMYIITRFTAVGKLETWLRNAAGPQRAKVQSDKYCSSHYNFEE